MTCKDSNAESAAPGECTCKQGFYYTASGSEIICEACPEGCSDCDAT